MKSIEQVLGFIEGWELAISTDDEELDKENQVLSTLKEIWAYIALDNVGVGSTPEQKYKYECLYAPGQVLSDYKGRKIYILDVLDNQYYYRDFNNLESRYYEDTHVIDMYYCLDSDIEEYKKWGDKIGDARVQDN